MLLLLSFLLIGSAYSVCPDAAPPLVTCNEPAAIVLDSTTYLSIPQINKEVEFIRTNVFPNFNWGGERQLAVYGTAGLRGFFNESNSIDFMCSELDLIQQEVLTNGQTKLTLKNIALGAAQQSVIHGEKAHIILFSAEQNATAIEDAGNAVMQYVVNSGITFYVVALNNAPFSFNNFPAGAFYNVDIDNLNPYPGLYACLLLNMCGEVNCDASVVPAAMTTTVARQTTVNPPVGTTAGVPAQTTAANGMATTTTTSAPTMMPQTTTQAPGFDDDGHECSCNYTNVWNDVMIVLDASQASTQDGLELMLNVVQSQLNFLTIQTAEGFTTKFHTRIGIVTYADTATVLYPLGSLSGDDLENLLQKDIPYVGSNHADIQAGINVAAEQFKTVYDRKNARNVIILMTRSYDPTGTTSPIATADEFKGNGGVIVIYEFALKKLDTEAGLEPISSPGFYFVSGEDLNGDILDQALCSANCFCPLETVPYVKNTSELLPAGGCYFTSFAQLNNNLAKHRCSSVDNGILADDRSAQKTAFLQSVAPTGDSFWLGLTWDALSNQYYWSDGKVLTENYQPWYSYQQPNQNLACVYSINGQWVQADCRISKYYLCEISQCDSDNYCEVDKLSAAMSEW